jgi:hypothetical protein
MITPNLTRWTVLEIASRVGRHIAPQLDWALLPSGFWGRLGVV